MVTTWSVPCPHCKGIIELETDTENHHKPGITFVDACYCEHCDGEVMYTHAVKQTLSVVKPDPESLAEYEQ